MKVLLGFHLADNESGMYLWRAFESLGWEVVPVCPRSVHPSVLVLKGVTTKPDLILISRELSLIPYVEQLKKIAPVVCWNFDVWDSVQHWVNYFPLFSAVDAYFTIAKGYIDEYKEVLGHDHVYWLSEGCDPTIHKPWSHDELTDAELTEFDCDVGFVGSVGSGTHPSAPFRDRLIHALKEEGFNVKIWGGGPNAIRYLKNDDLAKMSSVAKIVLCASGWKNVELSQSARIYRHLGSGAFCLEIAVKGIENWFNVGKEIDVYENIEHCIEKVEYYLKNKELRIQIANEGYKICHQKHTFKHRIITMLDILKQKGNLKKWIELH